MEEKKGILDNFKIHGIKQDMSMFAPVRKKPSGKHADMSTFASKFPEQNYFGNVFGLSKGKKGGY